MLKGTEKQVKYAEDLLAHLKKYTDKIEEGFLKGEALEEEIEEYNEFYESKIAPIINNEKSWEIIDKLRERNKKLYRLEQQEWLEKQITGDVVEDEYNLAFFVFEDLQDTFK